MKGGDPTLKKSSKEVPYILSIDPGETNGYAILDEVGDIITLGQIRGLDAFSDFLQGVDPFPEVVVVEEYRISPHVSHAYSKAITIQVIGAVKAVCRSKGVKVIEQATQFKPIGYKFLQMTAPKNHKISHQFDALAHGMYWMVKHGKKAL